MQLTVLVRLTGPQLTACRALAGLAASDMPFFCDESEFYLLTLKTVSKWVRRGVICVRLCVYGRGGVAVRVEGACKDNAHTHTLCNTCISYTHMLTRAHVHVRTRARRARVRTRTYTHTTTTTHTM